MVRPSVLFGLETVALNKQQEADLKMSKFSMGDEDGQDQE